MIHLFHTLDPRAWFDRYNCHGTFKCCQFVDQPMCNPPGRISLRERIVEWRAER